VRGLLGPLYPPNEQEQQEEEQKEGLFFPNEEFNFSLQWGTCPLINEKNHCLFGVTM
jgi:hypothetical protein